MLAMAISGRDVTAYLASSQLCTTKPPATVKWPVPGTDRQKTGRLASGLPTLTQRTRLAVGVAKLLELRAVEWLPALSALAIDVRGKNSRAAMTLILVPMPVESIRRAVPFCRCTLDLTDTAAGCVAPLGLPHVTREVVTPLKQFQIRPLVVGSVAVDVVDVEAFRDGAVEVLPDSAVQTDAAMLEVIPTQVETAPKKLLNGLADNDNRGFHGDE